MIRGTVVRGDPCRTSLRPRWCISDALLRTSVELSAFLQSVFSAIVDTIPGADLAGVMILSVAGTEPMTVACGEGRGLDVYFDRYQARKSSGARGRNARRMLVDWFVSVHEEESGVRFYRGGAGSDRASVIEGVIRAGREIARREDGSAVGDTGQVVIDGTPVGVIAFGDRAISDDELRREIGIAFDRVSVLYRYEL